MQLRETEEAQLLVGLKRKGRLMVFGRWWRGSCSNDQHQGSSSNSRQLKQVRPRQKDMKDCERWWCSEWKEGWAERDMLVLLGCFSAKRRNTRADGEKACWSSSLADEEWGDLLVMKVMDMHVQDEEKEWADGVDDNRSSREGGRCNASGQGSNNMEWKERIAWEDDDGGHEVTATSVLRESNGKL